MSRDVGDQLAESTLVWVRTFVEQQGTSNATRGWLHLLGDSQRLRTAQVEDVGNPVAWEREFDRADIDVPSLMLGVMDICRMNEEDRRDVLVVAVCGQSISAYRMSCRAVLGPTGLVWTWFAPEFGMDPTVRAWMVPAMPMLSRALPGAAVL